MSESPVKENIDLVLKLHEPEVYHSMGLFEEALRAYKQVLSDNPELDASSQKTIQEKIAALQEEIRDQEDDEVMSSSEPLIKEPSATKEDTSVGEDIPEILDSAAAFKKLGLVKEALAKYERLLEVGYPSAKTIPEIVECLFKAYSPSMVIQQAESIINKHGIEGREKAQIRFMLGTEMEKRGNKDMALDLYKSAMKTDPNDVEIKNKIASLMADVSSGSRYDYLVNQEMVNAEQLHRALILSEKMNKSLEFVLIEELKINKEEVGKSLSLFYDCPFRVFNPEMTLPATLKDNLEKSLLLKDLWVPLTWDNGGAEILVSDPSDFHKADYIRAMLKAEEISFSVGIKEDIEAFVSRFFDDKPEEEPLKSTDTSVDTLQAIAGEEHIDNEMISLDSLEEHDVADGQDDGEADNQEVASEEESIDAEIMTVNTLSEQDAATSEEEMDFDLIPDISFEEEDVDGHEELEEHLEVEEKETQEHKEVEECEVADEKGETEEYRGPEEHVEVEEEKDHGYKDAEGYEVLVEQEGIEEHEDAEEGAEAYEEVLDDASTKVERLVEQILVAAYQKNASAIHIEPSAASSATGIRFRIDGVCQDYLQFSTSIATGIISQLKIMANLDTAQSQMPQEGKIKFKHEDIPPFDLHLATIPTNCGLEDAVLRILANPCSMKLNEMGLSDWNLNVIKRISMQPQGLILVAGPAGSGTTTLLHAALGHINNPRIKIWTAEEPLEITQSGLRQVEVRPEFGLDFVTVIRSFLRADPDVIVIGEIRDHETAELGLEASQTGHLVFSSLHANSASEATTRLLDLGMNPLNLSGTFLGVLVQRLVRKLCPNCREDYHPSRDEFEEIVKDYGNEQFEATGIEFTPELTLYRPVGCEACSETGYKGCTAIHEIIEGTSQTRKLIRRDATSDDLFEQAVKDGMMTLKQDGISKVFMGLTDMDEVRRVYVG